MSSLGAWLLHSYFAPDCSPPISSWIALIPGSALRAHIDGDGGGRGTWQRAASIDEFHQNHLSELLEAVAFAQVVNGRRGGLPPIAGQLEAFVERKATCERGCVEWLRARAAFEATLLPAPGQSSLAEDASCASRRQATVAVVVSRFEALEAQCGLACGRKLARLMS